VSALGVLTVLAAPSRSAGNPPQTPSAETPRTYYFCTVGMRRVTGGVFYMSAVFHADGNPRMVTRSASQAWIAYVDDTFGHHLDARGDECKAARDARILEQTRTFYQSAQSEPDADPVIDTKWSYSTAPAVADRAGRRPQH
jgi:hypothetical protein